MKLVFHEILNTFQQDEKLVSLISLQYQMKFHNLCIPTFSEIFPKSYLILSKHAKYSEFHWGGGDIPYFLNYF